jgi:hypothetical protein
MEYNPGISLFFGLQNYKSSSNKKNYEQKSNIACSVRCSPMYIRPLPEMSGTDSNQH